MNTKITKIEIFKINIPLKKSFSISLGTVDTANNIAIRIHTDSGLIGTGECSPFVYILGETQDSAFEIAKDLSMVLLSSNPFEIENRLASLDKSVPGNNTIKSAFDMALYDLLGKQARLPLYMLLGGSCNREIISDMTVYLDSPKNMARDAFAYLKDGFPVIKVKLGTNKIDDLARITEIRKAIGNDLPIRIDANQGWDKVTAISILKSLKSYNIEYCEEPIPRWNHRDLKKVKEASPIPIMADESVFDHHDAFKLASADACDYFNIKLSKAGGIHNALKIIAVGESAGIKCQVGGMDESRFALTAITHLVAARNNISYFDLDSSMSHAIDPVIGGLEYKGQGKWVLPDLPGIGAEFDPEFLKNSDKIEII